MFKVFDNVVELRPLTSVYLSQVLWLRRYEPIQHIFLIPRRPRNIIPPGIPDISCSRTRLHIYRLAMTGLRWERGASACSQCETRTFTAWKGECKRAGDRDMWDTSRVLAESRGAVSQVPRWPRGVDVLCAFALSTACATKEDDSTCNHLLRR